MSSPFKPPEPPLKRDHNINIRLTSVERTAINQLARQMKVTPSHLVRHFLMQAVEVYSVKNGGHIN